MCWTAGLVITIASGLVAQDPYTAAKRRADGIAAQLDRLQGQQTSGRLLATSVAVDTSLDAYAEALNDAAVAAFDQMRTLATPARGAQLKALIEDYEGWAKRHTNHALAVHEREVQLDVRVRAGLVTYSPQELQQFTPADLDDFRRSVSPFADSVYRRNAPRLWPGAGRGGMDELSEVIGRITALALPSVAHASPVDHPLIHPVATAPAIGGAVAAACIVGGSLSLSSACIAAIMGGTAGVVAAYNDYKGNLSWCNKHVTKHFGLRKICKAGATVAFVATLA